MVPSYNKCQEKEAYFSTSASIGSSAINCCFRNTLKSPLPFPRKRLLKTIIIPTPKDIAKIGDIKHRGENF